MTHTIEIIFPDGDEDIVYGSNANDASLKAIRRIMAYFSLHRWAGKFKRYIDRDSSGIDSEIWMINKNFADYSK
jgi:hypothetical protein